MKQENIEPADKNNKNKQRKRKSEEMDEEIKLTDTNIKQKKGWLKFKNLSDVSSEIEEEKESSKNIKNEDNKAVEKKILEKIIKADLKKSKIKI